MSAILDNNVFSKVIFNFSCSTTYLTETLFVYRDKRVMNRVYQAIKSIELYSIDFLNIVLMDCSKRIFDTKLNFLT